ncbi:phage tail tape measure protein [Peptoniphilus sp. GNH]|nr:phage tail tape measure protein [Peptoniphilus sp. GNH]
MSVRELAWKLAAEGAGEFASDVQKADEKIDGLKKSMQETDKVSKSGWSKMQDNLTSTGSKFKSVGGSIAKVGAGLTATTMPLAIKLKQGVSDAKSLDTAIRQVTTLTDENILPTAELKKTVKRISNESGIMQEEVANAMYEALSSGVRTEDLTKFTEQGLKLTKAGFTDLPTVIDATTTALNAYGDAAPKVEKIQDIMVKTQDLGKITVDELGKSMGRVIPTAAAAGVGFDQLGASYAVLTSRGINAAEATTTMNSLLNELSSNGSKSDKALKEMTGKSFKQLTQEGKNIGDVLNIIKENAKSAGLELGDMFGNINAGKAANSLTQGGTDAYNKALDAMKNSDESVDKNYEKMMGDELEHAKAVEQLRNAFIDMGTQVMPIISNIMGKIGELAMKFQNLTPHQQKVISLIALGAVALGPVLLVIGGLVMAIGGLVAGIGMLTAPVAVAIGAFALLSAAGIALAYHWETIKAKAGELGGQIKSKLEGAANAVANGFNAMKSVVSNALETIKQKWEAVKAFFAKPIKGVVNVVGGAYEKIKGWLPSHATGLDSVPYDNYAANLHKDEMILTASAGRQYKKMGGTKDGLPSLFNKNEKQSVTNNKMEGSHNYNPTIIINYSGEGKEAPQNIASEVRKQLDIFFKEMQLQRA